MRGQLKSTTDFTENVPQAMESEVTRLGEELRRVEAVGAPANTEERLQYVSTCSRSRGFGAHQIQKRKSSRDICSVALQPLCSHPGASMLCCFSPRTA